MASLNEAMASRRGRKLRKKTLRAAVAAPGTGKQSPPSISKNQSAKGIYRKINTYSEAHQFGPATAGAKPNKAGNASALSPDRQRALAKGLKNRTTESSRKRLTNRILAAYGQKR